MKPKIKKMRWRKKYGDGDRLMALCFIALALFGLIMVYSASAPFAMGEKKSPYHFAIYQGIYLIIGLVVFYIVSKIPYEIYYKLGRPIFLLSILLCLLVFVPKIGFSVHNASRWIRIGSLTFMPSDFLKFGVVVILARLFTRKNRIIHEISSRSILQVTLPFLLILGLVFLLLFKQPDISTMGVILIASFLLYYIAGMPNTYFILGIIAAPVSLILLSKVSVRVAQRLNFMSDEFGSGWQAKQSRLAVGSGGLFGMGLTNSRQKFGFLANEAYNDFIFAVIAEEMGFIITTLFLLFLLFLYFRIFRMAARTKDFFGRYLAFGIGLILFTQTLLNIMVSLNLFFPTGLTLPFVSYGGTSLVLSFGLAGVLYNISKPRKHYVRKFEDSEKK